MRTVVDILEQRIGRALADTAGLDHSPAIIRTTADPKFGDYQANGVMAVAKQLRTNPRKLAEQVVAKLDLGELCETPEVAGPGFINLRLKPEYVASELLRINAGDANRLAIKPTEMAQTVVVDFSSPNIAKEMHVGHLRSTIIGDCICRLLEFEGHKVVRQNHIGDWGTQFGRVILGLWHMCMAEKRQEENGEPLYFAEELKALRALAGDGQELHALCTKIRDRHENDWRADKDPEEGDGELVFGPFLQGFPERPAEEVWPRIQMAYQYVNLLEECVVGMGLTIPTRQAGVIDYKDLGRHVTPMLQDRAKDPRNRQEWLAWNRVRELTMASCYAVYERLGVMLGPEHERGESAYQPMLPDVVDSLRDTGLAADSAGAVCVFPPGFQTKEGEPLPFIVQKSDGAFLYATTDLAALRYRVGQLKADRIIYVTDARQIQHFQMLFKVAEMAGWDRRNGRKAQLVHVTFGSVLGEDGKPLKARSGENVKLKDLLDEAVERAKAVVEEKNPDLPAEKKTQIAQAVGVGAVKYADYSNNRTSDYVFSFDKMLAMDGNTAPYMQYAYARIRSIERKAQSKGVDIASELAGMETLDLSEPAELDLGKHLARYSEAIEAAIADYKPNCLTAYLYELAQKFSTFYTNCPVLDAPPTKRPTRLLLCDLTAKTIRHGLSELLGIAVVEQM
ncbi:MAG: arginine--tRNA ligase [Sedimentisphaerales bacterium]|nr:arginine--tRNA ligase [Sedimentisphaerales bacterium]